VMEQAVTIVAMQRTEENRNQALELESRPSKKSNHRQGSSTDGISGNFSTRTIFLARYYSP